MSKLDPSILRAFNLILFIRIALSVRYFDHDERISALASWLFFLHATFQFVVLTSNSYLYSLLVVQHTVNSRLLALLCVSYVAFVMIPFVAFDLFVMTALRLSNLFNL